MKDGISQQRPAERIQALIDAIGDSAVNRTGNTCINIIHNEFVFLEEPFTVPRISVKELDTATSWLIAGNLVKSIPRFLAGHTFLEKRVPAADQHMMHFTRRLHGRVMDFTHIFKADMKFGGDPAGIVEKGNSDFYPSYRADRVYFKSRLIPESGHGERSDDESIIALRLFESDSVDSDHYRHTNAIFDETQDKELTKRINSHLERELFSISPELYPFLVYDYFTACLSVPEPDGEGIAGAVGVFEPLFLFIYSRFRNIGDLVNAEMLSAEFRDQLEFREGRLTMTENFMTRLKNYFSRWKLTRDGDMMLKGWWRFNKQ